MTEKQYVQAMAIAGSSSDGNAGMQTDIYTFSTRSAYGVSVMIACAAGNSCGVGASITLLTDFIGREFELTAEDFQIRTARAGMLADSNLIETVIKNYQKYDFGPLIVDPAIVTKHGNPLLGESTLQGLKEKLVLLAKVLAPNSYEAEKLIGWTLATEENFVRAVKELQDMGTKNVMIERHHAGDAQQETVNDYILLGSEESFRLNAPLYPTDRTNGAGGSLSACVAAESTKGKTVEQAIRLAEDYINCAIREEINVGRKYGPISYWAVGELE